MRLLALLLSLYLTCLSCLPCADEAPACPAPTRGAAVAPAHASGGSLAGDWCSPLCQCQCCSGAIAPGTAGAAAVASRPLPWADGARPGRLVAAAPTRAPGAIWQPPRA